MPELQIDVAVANRFMSSLSKSLQALCHGCMDFDSGIEIVGYINVNIDSGSKVDYVLNEKVLKSTTNSMTFVSNSFLARKDQLKQTRDGACSPILEINQSPRVTSPYQNRLQGSFRGSHGSQFSYAHRGSQKRSWAAMERDWRMSPKKLRDGKPQYASPHNPAHSQTLPSTASQNQGNASLKWAQTSTQSSDTTSMAGHSEISIKKEVFDSDPETKIGQIDNDQPQTDQEAADNADEGSTVSSIRIKNDPDAATTEADDEGHATEGAGNDSNTDIKDTFLEPSTSADNQNKPEQSEDQTDTNNQLLESSSHVDNQEESEMHTENASGSEIPVDYDEPGEEGAYSQSVYSDAGEGSNDGGQFEVIEIDDEDEDVQAMFGGSQRKMTHTGQGLPQLHSYQSRPHHSGQARESKQSHQLPTLHGARLGHGDFCAESSLQCSFCDCTLETRSMFQKHMNECHRDKNALPFTCSICQKGFFSLTGLRHHIEAHGGRQFVCNVCDARFQHKHNLKRHIVGVHKLRECPSCNITINDGPDYNTHVVRCGTGSKFEYNS